MAEECEHLRRHIWDQPYQASGDDDDDDDDDDDEESDHRYAHLEAVPTVMRPAPKTTAALDKFQSDHYLTIEIC